jgi:hypothetical protein
MPEQQLLGVGAACVTAQLPASVLRTLGAAQARYRELSTTDCVAGVVASHRTGISYPPHQPRERHLRFSACGER